MGKNNKEIATFSSYIKNFFMSIKPFKLNSREFEEAKFVGAITGTICLFIYTIAFAQIDSRFYFMLIGVAFLALYVGYSMDK